MDRSIMLDNRSKDSYLLLHWQDRMSEERRGEQVSWKEKQKRNYENINKGSFR